MNDKFVKLLCLVRSSCRGERGKEVIQALLHVVSPGLTMYMYMRVYHCHCTASCSVPIDDVMNLDTNQHFCTTVFFFFENTPHYSSRVYAYSECVCLIAVTKAYFSSE